MWPFHRHGWKRRLIQQGKVDGFPVSYIGFVCQCGKTKTRKVKGHWTAKDFEGCH